METPLLGTELLEFHIARLESARDRMVRAARAIPADRVNWSPGPEARTPVQIVFHSAMSVYRIQRMIVNCEPHATPTMAEADAEFLAEELGQIDMDDALALLETNVLGCVDALRAAGPKATDHMIRYPFGMGEGPWWMSLGFLAAHTNEHTAQLEYLQTCLGNRVW